MNKSKQGEGYLDIEGGGAGNGFTGVITREMVGGEVTIKVTDV